MTVGSGLILILDQQLDLDNQCVFFDIYKHLLYICIEIFSASFLWDNYDPTIFFVGTEIFG